MSAQSTTAVAAAASVTLAEYLFTRLRQVGVHSLHGVPGDYNLELLDYVVPSGLHWNGGCNELNAAYAADGYARVKGAAALVTTFGVGELSALNGVAGAFAELAPVVHIVGSPARVLQETHAKVHHTLLDGDYGHFRDMYKHITVAQASLRDARACPDLIDSTIRQCLLQSRPVYIEVPADMVAVPVAAERLQTPLEVPGPAPPPPTVHAEALKLVLERIYTSKQPVIIVDGEVRPYGVVNEIQQFVQSTGLPTWTTVFGKGWVDEDLPNVHGIWRGPFSTPEVKEYIKSSDLVLWFGPHLSNTNTYIFSALPDPATSILFESNSIRVGNGDNSSSTGPKEKLFRDLPTRYFLPALLQELDISRAKSGGSAAGRAPAFPPSDTKPAAVPQLSPDGAITQAHFYHVFNHALRPGDIVLGETGTASHGIRDFRLPPHTQVFGANSWLSIGYMLPATQGAALAQREMHTAGLWPRLPKKDNGGGGEQQQQQQQQKYPPRSVLLIGDGSFQMTAQELSVIVRERLNVVLVLLNNDGYTIERCLHGWRAAYNDVPAWQYRLAPALFGATEDRASPDYHARTYAARTWQELQTALADIDADPHHRPRLSMLEVYMPKDDAPGMLADLMAIRKKEEGS